MTSCFRINQIIIFIKLLTLICIMQSAGALLPSPYLIKPGGSYAVSVEKYNWVNNNICPDPFYKESDNTLYKNNPDHCHMLDVYIFYPTTSKSKQYLVYPNDTVLQVKHDLKTGKIKPIQQEYAKAYIKELQHTGSYILPKQKIAKGKFPLIIFQPGFAFNSNNYQNFIANLVSNGYIVVAIDSAYSATISRDDSYLLRNETQYAADGKPSVSFMQGMFASTNSNLSAMKDDYSYVLNKLYSERQSNQLATHIDFTKTAGVGHSLGAISLYEKSIAKDNQLKAFVSLDFGQSRNKSLHEYYPHIPALFFRAAYDIEYGKEMQTSSVFNLESNSYVVLMTPDIHNTDYSKHTTFSDYITIKNDATLWALRDKTYGNFTRPWASTHSSYAAAYSALGTANGNEFTYAVNQYLLMFLNYELKGKAANNLGNCNQITSNSILFCGPGVVR